MQQKIKGDDKTTYDFPRGRGGDIVKVRFRANRYADNGTLAITMENRESWAGSDYWGPYGVLTVNIPDYSDRLAGNTQAFVDINKFGPGIVAWLEKHGIATCTSIMCPSGHCMYPLMEFDEDFVASHATREYLEYASE